MNTVLSNPRESVKTAAKPLTCRHHPTDGCPILSRTLRKGGISHSRQQGVCSKPEPETGRQEHRKRARLQPCRKPPTLTRPRQNPRTTSDYPGPRLRRRPPIVPSLAPETRIRAVCPRICPQLFVTACLGISSPTKSGHLAAGCPTRLSKRGIPRTPASWARSLTNSARLTARPASRTMV